MIISGFVGYRYLSRPDDVAVEVSAWIKANKQSSDIILYQPRHLASVMDYEHQLLLSHLSGQRTWIWTRSTPEWERLRALQNSIYAIVTNAPDKIGPMESLRHKFKGTPSLPPESIAQTWRNNLELIFGSDTFCLYKVRDDSFAKP